MKPIVTWIVVADGGRMRIFENDGPGKGLAQVKGLAVEDEHLTDQDIEADRPGRSFASVGHGRSAIEPHTDPVEFRETAFAGRIAHLLDAKLAAGAFDRLIIAAAPTALGSLRAALSEAVGKTVTGELPKDLTKTPTNDLASHFDGLIAL